MLRREEGGLVVAVLTFPLVSRSPPHSSLDQSSEKISVSTCYYLSTSRGVSSFHLPNPISSRWFFSTTFNTHLREVLEVVISPTSMSFPGNSIPPVTPQCPSDVLVPFRAEGQLLHLLIWLSWGPLEALSPPSPRLFLLKGAFLLPGLTMAFDHIRWSGAGWMPQLAREWK